jgi:hypothetical protein
MRSSCTTDEELLFKTEELLIKTEELLIKREELLSRNEAQFSGCVSALHAKHGA